MKLDIYRYTIYPPNINKTVISNNFINGKIELLFGNKFSKNSNGKLDINLYLVIKL